MRKLKLVHVIQRRAELATRKAFRRALRSGAPVLVSDNGTIYEVRADGSRKPLKRIEPPSPVVRGQKFLIP